MRKLILISFIFSLILVDLSAQEKSFFLLTNKNVIESTTDPEKEYVTILFPQEEKQNLYTKIVNLLKSNSYHQNITIDEESNPDYLLLTNTIDNFKDTGYTIVFTYSVNFWDEKIRVNKPLYKVIRVSDKKDCTSNINYSRSSWYSSQSLKSVDIESEMNKSIRKLIDIN